MDGWMADGGADASEGCFWTRVNKEGREDIRELEPTGAYWTSKKALVLDMAAED
jgi:hypothetical protein